MNTITKRSNPLRCRVCHGQIEDGDAIGGELPDGTKWAEHADLSVCENSEPHTEGGE